MSERITPREREILRQVLSEPALLVLEACQTYGIEEDPDAEERLYNELFAALSLWEREDFRPLRPEIAGAAPWDADNWRVRRSGEADMAKAERDRQWREAGLPPLELMGPPKKYKLHEIIADTEPDSDIARPPGGAMLAMGILSVTTPVHCPCGGTLFLETDAKGHTRAYHYAADRNAHRSYWDAIPPHDVPVSFGHVFVEEAIPSEWIAFTEDGRVAVLRATHVVAAFDAAVKALRVEVDDLGVVPVAP